MGGGEFWCLDAAWCAGGIPEVHDEDAAGVVSICGGVAGVEDGLKLHRLGAFGNWHLGHAEAVGRDKALVISGTVLLGERVTRAAGKGEDGRQRECGWSRSASLHQDLQYGARGTRSWKARRQGRRILINAPATRKTIAAAGCAAVHTGPLNGNGNTGFHSTAIAANTGAHHHCCA